MVKHRQENQNPRGKGGKGIIAAGIIVIIALLAVIIYLVLPKKEGNTTKRNVVINKSNVEQAVADIEAKEPVRSGFYEVTMNTAWTFSDGTSASENAYVENVETNTNDVYFDINRADTDELIYSSPIIPRGSYLDQITLDAELSAGTYDCIVTYHLVDEQQQSISTLKINLTITVES